MTGRIHFVPKRTIRRSEQDIPMCPICHSQVCNCEVPNFGQYFSRDLIMEKEYYSMLNSMILSSHLMNIHLRILSKKYLAVVQLHSFILEIGVKPKSLS